MRFVIVTGMSGAGKSTALKVLEDASYFCVDNLPVQLIDKFAELTMNGASEIQKVAIGVDIRSGELLESLENVLAQMDHQKFKYEILFLDAQDAVLIKRYKETRRIHPLAGSDRVDVGIERERQKLAFLRKRADYILDTSHLLTRELKAELNKIFVRNIHYENLFITILSFGFKNGIPRDSDLVFDVRFLPNPYYVDKLREKTGIDQEVRDYIMKTGLGNTFLDKLEDMITFLVPQYVAEGKSQLVIAIGCTGGRHRSVTIADELYERLSHMQGYGVRLEHRDLERDRVIKNF